MDKNKTFIDVLLDKTSTPQAIWLTLYKEGEYIDVSCDELLSRVQAYIHVYRAHHLKPGDVVLIILKESTDLFASFFAGIAMGLLPAFYAYPSAKQSRERFLEHVQDLVQFNEVALTVSYDEVIDILEKTPFFTGKSYFKGFVRFDSVNYAPFNLNDLRSQKLSEAFLQFSSGTTGAKKGVKISVQALFNQIDAYQDKVYIDQDSRVVSWLPHYHDMGLIACMLMPFIKGARIYMMSPFEWVRQPQILLDVITKVKGTHVWLPNFALGHIVSRVSMNEADRYSFSSIKSLVLCSEPALSNTVNQFLKHFKVSNIREDQIVNCYAMAENTFAMTTTGIGEGIRFLKLQQEALRKSHQALDAKEELSYTVASCGKPLSNIQIRVVDDTLKDCPERNVGVILIKSDCMLQEYHRNSQATSAAMTPDGWFNTGDLGFLDHGELFVTGRKKDLIIVGGENIYPQDIEEILNAHPSLLPGRNVVFGAANELAGTEKIVALAEMKQDDDSEQAQIIMELRKSVLDQLNTTLSEIILLSPQTLKKSTAGKISRHLNKELYLAGEYRIKTMETKVAASNGQLLLVLKDFLKRRGLDALTVEGLNEQTKLITSGLVDSFMFVELVTTVEQMTQVRIAPDLIKVENFDTLTDIERTISCSQGGFMASHEITVKRLESLTRLQERPVVIANKTWKEWLIEKFPWPTGPLYILLLRMLGLKVSWKALIMGNIRLKLRGPGENIVIEDGVRISAGVDMRTREQGKIVLRKGSYIDEGVRLVAAREGMIEFLCGAEIGRGSIINSGGTVRIGRYAMIASNVSINSSSHGINIDAFVKEQPHEHGKVEIADDVWVGSGVSIVMGAVINEGAIIASNSLVSGQIPAFAVCGGVPAKVLYYR